MCLHFRKNKDSDIQSVAVQQTVWNRESKYIAGCQKATHSAALTSTLVFGVPPQGERGSGRSEQRRVCVRRWVEGRGISTRVWNLWNLLNTHEAEWDGRCMAQSNAWEWERDCVLELLINSSERTACSLQCNTNEQRSYKNVPLCVLTVMDGTLMRHSVKQLISFCCTSYDQLKRGPTTVMHPTLSVLLLLNLHSTQS